MVVLDHSFPPLVFGMWYCVTWLFPECLYSLSVHSQALGWFDSVTDELPDGILFFFLFLPVLRIKSRVLSLQCKYSTS
jgi:hypothetical protein